MLKKRENVKRDPKGPLIVNDFGGCRRHYLADILLGK